MIHWTLTRLNAKPGNSKRRLARLLIIVTQYPVSLGACPKTWSMCNAYYVGASLNHNYSQQSITTPVAIRSNLKISIGGVFFLGRPLAHNCLEFIDLLFGFECRLELLYSGAGLYVCMCKYCAWVWRFCVLRSDESLENM